MLKQDLGDFSDYVAANPSKYHPVVYSQREIRALFEAMQGKYRLMARLHYGCGLRVSELCRLRVKDIDMERNKLYVRAGKGDRVRRHVQRSSQSEAGSLLRGFGIEDDSRPVLAK